MTNDTDTDYPRVVIDDERTHAKGGIHLRSSKAALNWLGEHKDAHIGELWLDHDLSGDDTIRPVVLYLEERCFAGSPVEIGIIYVHTGSHPGAKWIMSSNLLREHYAVVRKSISDNFISQEVP